MKLQEIFDQLSAGEFSQLSIGGAVAGVLDESNYDKVLGHINLGLTKLFTRFNLKEGRFNLALQPAQTTYKLHSSFAVNVRRSRETIRYILDTVEEPFRDDLLKVERVLDSDGCDYPINDETKTYSVFTPSALRLRVPEIMVPADVTDELTVVYRANHVKLTLGLGYFDPTRIEVQLPDSHLEALLYFVASRVNNPIGMTNEFHAGNSYAAKFEVACQELEGKGMQVDVSQTNDRLTRGGWA